MFVELLAYPVSIFCSFAENKNGFLTYELRPLFNNRHPHRKAGKRHGTPVYDMKVNEYIEHGAVFECCQLAADIIGREEGVRISRINCFAISVMGKDIWHRPRINAELSRDVLP